MPLLLLDAFKNVSVLFFSFNVNNYVTFSEKIVFPFFYSLIFMLFTFHNWFLSVLHSLGFWCNIKIGDKSLGEQIALLFTFRGNIHALTISVMLVMRFFHMLLIRLRELTSVSSLLRFLIRSRCYILLSDFHASIKMILMCFFSLWCFKID